MKLNKKLLIFGAVLLILLWSGNIFYYEKQILKEPLFIKCYYDLPNYMNMFNLSYIQNINSQDKITNISFPELGTEPISFNEVDMNSDNKYHILKLITITLFQPYPSKMPDEYKNKLITKANITFSSGKTLSIHIGKIYLGEDVQENENSTAYASSQNSTSESNDISGGTTFKAERDLNILGISNKFYEDTRDILKISIDGKELSDVTFPIKLKKGQLLYINYSFIFDKSDVRKNNSYDLKFNVLAEDSLGIKENSSFFITSNLNISPRDLDIDLLKTAMEEN